MNWQDLFTGVGTGSSLIGDIWQLFGLTGSQKAQNEYNSQEAEKNRQFQAQQAQDARDWQEYYYNTYSSPQAMVEQYEAAGLNPALMYGSGSSSTGSAASTSIPSGSAASSAGSGNSMSLMSALGTMLAPFAQLQLVESEKDKNLADAEESRANAGLQGSRTTGQDITNKYLSRQYELQLKKGEIEIGLIEANISQANANTDLLIQQTQSDKVRQFLMDMQAVNQKAQASLAGVQSEYISAQTWERNWKNAFMDKFGFDPESQFLPMLMQIGVNGDLTHAVDNIISVLSEAGERWSMSSDSGIPALEDFKDVLAEISNNRERKRSADGLTYSERVQSRRGHREITRKEYKRKKRY